MERLLKSISASSFPVKSLEPPTFIAELKRVTDEIKSREEGQIENLRPLSEPAPIEITVIQDLAKLRQIETQDLSLEPPMDDITKLNSDLNYISRKLGQHMDAVLNSIHFLRAYLGDTKTIQGENLFRAIEEECQNIPEAQELQNSTLKAKALVDKVHALDIHEILRVRLTANLQEKVYNWKADLLRQQKDLLRTFESNVVELAQAAQVPIPQQLAFAMKRRAELILQEEQDEAITEHMDILRIYESFRQEILQGDVSLDGQLPELAPWVALLQENIEKGEENIQNLRLANTKISRGEIEELTEVRLSLERLDPNAYVNQALALANKQQSLITSIVNSVRHDVDTQVGKIIRCEKIMMFILGESEVTVAELRNLTGEAPGTNFKYGNDLESQITWLSRLEHQKKELIEKLREQATEEHKFEQAGIGGMAGLARQLASPEASLLRQEIATKEAQLEEKTIEIATLRSQVLSSAQQGEILSKAKVMEEDLFAARRQIVTLEQHNEQMEGIIKMHGEVATQETAQLEAYSQVLQEKAEELLQAQKDAAAAQDEKNQVLDELELVKKGAATKLLEVQRAKKEAEAANSEKMQALTDLELVKKGSAAKLEEVQKAKKESEAANEQKKQALSELEFVKTAAAAKASKQQSLARSHSKTVSENENLQAEIERLQAQLSEHLRQSADKDGEIQLHLEDKELKDAQIIKYKTKKAAKNSQIEEQKKQFDQHQKKSEQTAAALKKEAADKDEALRKVSTETGNELQKAVADKQKEIDEKNQALAAKEAELEAQKAEMKKAAEERDEVLTKAAEGLTQLDAIKKSHEEREEELVQARKDAEEKDAQLKKLTAEGGSTQKVLTEELAASKQALQDRDAAHSKELEAHTTEHNSLLQASSGKDRELQAALKAIVEKEEVLKKLKEEHETALAKHILVKDAEITVAKKAHDEAATVYNQQIAEKDEKLTAFKESTDQKETELAAAKKEAIEKEAAHKKAMEDHAAELVLQKASVIEKDKELAAAQKAVNDKEEALQKAAADHKGEIERSKKAVVDKDIELASVKFTLTAKESAHKEEIDKHNKEVQQQIKAHEEKKAELETVKQGLAEKDATIKKIKEDHEAELHPIKQKAKQSEESSALAIKVAEDKSAALQRSQQEAEMHLKAYKQTVKQNEELKAKVESQVKLVAAESERDQARSVEIDALKKAHEEELKVREDSSVSNQVEEQLKKIKEDHETAEARAKQLKSENEILRTVLERETKAKNEALETKNEYDKKLREEKMHSGNLGKILSENDTLKQTILTYSQEKKQAEEVKKERDVLEEKAQNSKEKKKVWRDMYQKSADKQRHSQPGSPDSLQREGNSPTDFISLSPIKPGKVSPFKTEAAPPKPGASPPKPDADVEEIEEFATFGTDPAQIELMQIRANDRHVVKSAARKQRLVRKEGELQRKDAEIARLNEELAKAEKNSKQRVDVYKNMLANQTKDAKERYEEKDKQIASLLLTPVQGSEDLQKIVKKNNKTMAAQQEEIAEAKNQIADLNAIQVEAGTEIVKQLQADNDRLKKEKEEQQQELREKTAILKNFATQGPEETKQLKGIIMQQVNAHEELKAKSAEQEKQLLELNVEKLKQKNTDRKQLLVAQQQKMAEMVEELESLRKIAVVSTPAKPSDSSEKNERIRFLEDSIVKMKEEAKEYDPELIKSTMKEKDSRIILLENEMSAIKMAHDERENHVQELTDELIELRNALSRANPESGIYDELWLDVELKEEQINELEDKLKRFEEDEPYKEITNSGERIRNKTYRRLSTIALDNVEKAFDKWNFLVKEMTEISIDLTPIQISPPTKTPVASQAFRSTEDEEEALMVLTNNLQDIFQTTLNNNPLLAQWAHGKARGIEEKPLSPIQVYKFFEDLMDEKYTTDSQDLRNQRLPRTFPEFILEYIDRQKGLKSLSIKFLSSLYPTLQKLCESENPYGILICRFFQLFHPEPIPYNLAIYLTRLRIEINDMTEKYATEQEKIEKQRARDPKYKKPAVKSHGQKMMEKLENGGKCSLYDAIQLMHKIFESQRIFGELAIQLLRPMDMDLFEYIVFNICFKMVKMGKSAEQMFTFIDESCDGAITEDEFVNGVREDLGLWLTDTDLVTVFQKVDLDGTGMLDKKEFMQVLNLDSFFKKKESSVYVSNKREMLDAVIGTFDDIQRRDGVYVYKFFTETSNSSTVMNEETMLTSLKDLAEGTEVSDEIFQLVIDDAKKLSQVPHGIDNQGYTRAVLKWNLGNWGYGPIGEYFEEERIQLLSVHEERYMAYKNPQPMQEEEKKKSTAAGRRKK